MFTLQGHVGSVTALSFSPDGKRLVSASEHGILKVWETFSGKEILTLGYAAQRVAWQGGKLILLGGPAQGDGLKGTLLRLNADGSQDSAFGTAGKVTLPGTPSQLAGLVVTPDNKINVCADYHQYTSTEFHDLRITRYTKDGA